MKILLLGILTMIGISGTTDYVKLQVTPTSVETVKGHDAYFYLRLRAEDGIHVNAEPAVIIKSGTEGAELSIADLPKKGNYLDPGKPMKVLCRTNGLAPGRHRIDFVLTYTFCSDSEGWCRMNRDSSSIEILIRK